jgi:uncharacterized protein
VGTLVLAEDMGATSPMRRDVDRRETATATDNPVIVASNRAPSDWLKPVADQIGHFRADVVGRVEASPSAAITLDFFPLYRLHDRTYSVYMTLFTPKAWSQRTGGTQ